MPSAVFNRALFFLVADFFPTLIKRFGKISLYPFQIILCICPANEEPRNKKSSFVFFLLFSKCTLLDIKPFVMSLRALVSENLRQPLRPQVSI